MNSSIIVVIVTYNAMRWAERCFTSLMNSTLLPDVYVVDNGSSDGTQSYIKEHFPDVMFHQSEENLGFGKANNMGMQYALDNNYDYVYLLNQDAWVMSDTFEKLVNLSKKYPEYGIISPFQMNKDMIHIDSGFVERTCSYSSNSFIFSDLFNNNIKDIYTVNEVMAAHWLITKDCLSIVGGFSPSFNQYGEDNNYLNRVSYWGKLIGIVPSLCVVHDRGSRIDSNYMKIRNGYTYSIHLMSRTNFSPWKSFVLSLSISINNAIAFKSILPFLFFIKLSFNLLSILRNRKKSMSDECSFLKIK